MAFQAANHDPQYIQHTVAGGNPNTDPLLTPSGFPSGTVLLDQTTSQLYVLRRVGGVAAWVLIGGGGSVLPTGVQGDLLYHNGTGWVTLAAGANNNVLQTHGPGANPTWAGAGGGGGLLPSGVQGDILYHNGTTWVTLAAGANNNVLQTHGPGANPTWAGAGGGGGLLPAGAVGEILYHDGTTWVTLGAGAAGRLLQANGPAAPSWIPTGGGMLPTGTQIGQLLYWNGAAWVTLNPGGDGNFLQSNGVGAPSWGNSTSVSLQTVTGNPTPLFTPTVLAGQVITYFAIVSGVRTDNTAFAGYVTTASFNNVVGLNQLGQTNISTIESDASWTCEWNNALLVSSGGVAVDVNWTALIFWTTASA